MTRRRTVKLRFAALLSVFCILNSAFAQDRLPQPAEPTDWRALTAAPQSVDLASIRPLPIVHYSWPIRAQDVLPTPAWWLHDFVRITRGATIHADTGTTEAHVRALAKIAAQYNASVAIVMAPYHHTSWSDGDPRRTDATYWPWWIQRLHLMRSWVEAEGASVRCLIYDCERFILKTPESEPDAQAREKWNAAARERYDEAYAAGKAALGESCYIEWYSRGWYRPIGVERVQRFAGPYGHFDLSEKGDGVSAVITRPDWIMPSLASVQETVLTARDKPLVIWLWLGSGYQYAAGSLGVNANWDYGARAAKAYSRLLVDYDDRLRCMIFYPSPGINPHWLRHFAAYAESAGE